MSPELANVNPRCCRICGSNAGRYFVANGFDWIWCTTCRTTQKVLTRQQYLDLNPTYDPGAYLDSRDRATIEKILDVDGATAVIAGAVHKFLGGMPRPPNTRLFLDVGCGMGSNLIAAQRLGFDVLGLNPAPLTRGWLPNIIVFLLFLIISAAIVSLANIST